MPPSAELLSGCRRFAALMEQVFDDWSRDNAPRLAASLAYYSILALAPILVLSIAVAGRLFGPDAIEGQLAWEIQTLVGQGAALAIQAVLRDAHQPAAGLISTVLSIVTLAVGASSVVIELHSALNLIWGVPDSDAGSWLRNIMLLLKQRLYSTLIVVAAGCLLLVSLVASVFVAAIGSFFHPWLPAPEWFLHVTTFLASFLVVTLLFAAIYKLLPDVRIRWSDVTIGAIATSLLFVIGKQLLAIYLGHVGFQSTYGAAWTVIFFLVWIYYSAQLFFLGAEFTKIYARNYGSHRSSSQVAPEVSDRN